MVTQHGLQTKKAFWRYYSLILLFIILALSLTACDSVTICMTTSSNSSCPPAATPTRPTAPPANTPTPTTVPPGSAPPPTATPTPQTPETSKQEAQNLAQRYVNLAMARKPRKLYNLISSELRNSMDYNQFSHDSDYVLSDSPTCWREDISGVIISPHDQQSWDVGVPMTQVSCTDGSTIATFDWHLRILVPPDNSGPPVVTQAGLYPTGN